MNTGAFCKTEAVQTFKTLLKQRRRWFLGFITNEVCMLTDIRLWKRYPLLLIIRLAQNTIRTTALLFFIMVISILTTSQKIKNLPIGFIAVSLGLSWLLMIYFGAKLGRYKIMWYPLMFVVNPFMNWLYMVYGIFTAGQRTWGGPRADAGKADEHTTPAQAIERAAQTGDELNVVPETFKPAIEAAMQRLPHQVPLLPSGHLEGRFVPAEQLPGGWYRQSNDSGALYADMTPRAAEAMLYPKDPRRDSTESTHSGMSTTDSLHTPRRVESIFAAEEALAYLDRQTRQRPPGGAYFEARELEARIQRLERTMPAFSNGPLPKMGSAVSINSAASESSVPLHFGIPHRVPTQPATGAQEPAAGTPPPEIRVPIRGPLSSHPPTGFGNTLAPPGAVHRPGDSSNRTGKSPLARKSFTRFASPPPADEQMPLNAAEVIELERVSAARASLEAERRGRERERHGRRRPGKLSKQRPGSRSGSEG